MDLLLAHVDIVDLLAPLDVTAIETIVNHSGVVCRYWLLSDHLLAIQDHRGRQSWFNSLDSFCSTALFLFDALHFHFIKLFH